MAHLSDGDLLTDLVECLASPHLKSTDPLMKLLLGSPSSVQLSQLEAYLRKECRLSPRPRSLSPPPGGLTPQEIKLAFTNLSRLLGAGHEEKYHELASIIDSPFISSKDRPIDLLLYHPTQVDVGKLEDYLRSQAYRFTGSF